MKRLLPVALLLLLTACAAQAPTDPQAQRPSVPDATIPLSDDISPPAVAKEPPHPVSLPALMEKELAGSELTLGAVLAKSAAYTRYAITYKSGTLRISGIMNVPAGTGPFPVLILNHGFIDPKVYTQGRGLKREQDRLARAGYVVLHTDYRNHAASDDDPENDVKLRLGYVEDVLNAVDAVQKSELPFLDGERIGMLGHSMGGGLTLSALVTKPGLVDGAVLFAPVNRDARMNFERWQRRDGDLAERIRTAYGTPETNPGFWENISAGTFFSRVQTPVLVHHGTADDDVPIEWSHDLETSLKAENKDVTLRVYPGEGHEFARAWNGVMDETIEFFDRTVR